MVWGAVLHIVERSRSYGTLNGTPSTARSASRMSRSLQRGASKSEGRPTGMGLSSDVSTRRSLSEMGVARVRDAPTECPTEAGSVKPAITLKRSVTETKGGASKPVLPPPPERRPRDGTRAPRVCRGDASAVSTGEQGGTRRPVGRVLSGYGRSSQGRDPALGRGAAGARASRGAAPSVWPRAPARARAGLARQRLSLGQTAAPHPARVAAGAAHASRRAGVAPRAERLAHGQSRHPGPIAAAPAPPPAVRAAAMLARPA